MAKTAFTTSSAETKKLWEEKFFRDTVLESFWNKFEGEGSNNVVQVQRMLEKSQGDQVYFFIRYTPTNVGVGPGSAMEGNEDKLLTASDSVTLTRRRYAVRDNGELDRQRALFSIDVESEMSLKEWAVEWIDREKFFMATYGITYSAFLAGGSKVTNTKVFYGGDATSDGDLAADDLITPAQISRMVAYAKQTNAHSRVALRPIKIKGRDYFVLLVHPDVAYDLKRNSEYLQNLRECLQRSPDHPIFTGALGVSHDGVIFHEHEKIEISNTLGSGAVSGAYNLFMGQQALCWAWGHDMLSVTKKKFDYDEEHGYQISLTYGGTRSAFTKPGGSSADYGIMRFTTARTKITDA